MTIFNIAQRQKLQSKRVSSLMLGDNVRICERMRRDGGGDEGSVHRSVGLGRLECARASVRVRECVHTQARLQHAHARSSRKCTQAHQAAGENLAG